jgi:ribokinase
MYFLGLTTVFNPAPISENIINVFSFNLVDYLIVNKLEAVQLYKQTSGFSLEEDISVQDQLKFISNEFKDLIGIIVTLGSEGLYAWYKPEQKMFNLPAFKTKVLDTTGAGDTFTGYFTSGIVRSLKQRRTNNSFSTNLPTSEDFLNALKEATVAAGLAVSQPGAMESIPSFSDVQKSKFMFNI